MKNSTRIDIENYVDKINKYFVSFLKGEPSELYEASAHYIKSGGKRLRPLMAIKSCEMFGGTQERALPAASAVEFIHNFSLVHDDIMDNDDMRHGIPTVHKNFGVPIAILSGDILFSKAFQILSYNKNNEFKDSSLLNMIRRLSTACIDICEGQCQDIQFSHSINFPSEYEYLEMITKKTAALFEVSCSLGALSAQSTTDTDVNNMADFGRYSGIAFQLIDDLIGISGDVSITGKAVGNDIREGKKTYPILLSLAKASESERTAILEVFGNNHCENTGLKRAIEIISSLQIEDLVRKNAMSYIARAMEAINHYEESSPKVILKEISHYIVNRSK